MIVEDPLTGEKTAKRGGTSFTLAEAARTAEELKKESVQLAKQFKKDAEQVAKKMADAASRGQKVLAELATA
jgi:hypothetical protein